MTKQNKNMTQTVPHPTPPLPLYDSQFPFIYTSTQSLHSLPTPIRTHLYLHKPTQHSQHIHHCGPPKTTLTLNKVHLQSFPVSRTLNSSSSSCHA